MAGDTRHLHDPAKAEEFARALGLMVGGAGHPFVGNWGTKGLYAYRSGQYKGMAYFGTGGSERDRLTMPHESEKYRPWNRYDPNIPDHIRKKLIELEDDDSTSIAQPSQPARAQPSVEPSSDDMLRGENILVSGHSIPKYNGIYAIQTNEINGKPWYKNNSGCILYFYNANSGGGPSWSLDDRSQDGTNDWFRGGWIEPPNSGGPPLGTRRWAIFETHRRFEIKLESVSIPDDDSRRRNDVGKIALKSVHGKYLSAQPDGRAEWNRTVANDWEFFEMGERDGRKITLRSTHGKYVSAQPDGTVQINREHAPPGGWEEFTVETRPGSTPGDAHDFLHLKSVHGKYLSAQADGTVQWNRDRAPPGGWEDIQFVPQAATRQVSAAATRIQRHLNTGRTSTSASDEAIQVLEAVPGQPVRFRLNDPPNHNEAWVGIYPTGASDQDHGAPPRWKFIRDVDVNNVSLSNGELAAGDWSIRVFSDGGYTLVERKEITIHSANKILSSKAVSPASESIEILEAVTKKPVRFKINNPPTNHDAWVGIYPPNASDQDHGAENNRWKWLRNVDVNNVSFPKRAAGSWSIRVFSNGGHALHERKDFDVRPAEPADPAVVESSRRSAFIALVIGMVLLAPSIPLFIAGLGEGLSDGMTSATLDIEDGDGQGDLGWTIYVEGNAVDFNSNGIFDHCENIIVNATHSGSWMSDPWTEYQSVNAPDETRQVFYLETAHEGNGCNSNDGVWPELRYHDGRDLIKIGRACHGCMAGTTTITAQNSDGGEVVMWIQNEEKKEVLGMLIPGAIFMGIGGFTFFVSLFVLLSMGFKSNAPSSSKRRAGKTMGVGITLFIMGLPLLIIGSISTGEGRLAMLIPGAVIFSIGSFILFISVTAVIRMGSTEGYSSVAGTGTADGASTGLEVLSFNHRQPVRFSITNPPGHNEAWVGLYPASADDRNHGDRWHYLRDIDVSNATFPGQEQGPWSLRLFSDGGYTLHQRVDFELRPSSKEEIWMKEAEFDGQRLNGLIPDHRNNFTKKVTTSKIVAQHKVGNTTRFDTDVATYLVYDHDLQTNSNSQNPFW